MVIWSLQISASSGYNIGGETVENLAYSEYMIAVREPAEKLKNCVAYLISSAAETRDRARPYVFGVSARYSNP